MRYNGTPSEIRTRKLHREGVVTVTISSMGAYGTPDRTRTYNLYLVRVALSQLSYWCIWMPQAGFEPVISVTLVHLNDSGVYDVV